jgi:hypothetical protein
VQLLLLRGSSWFFLLLLHQVAAVASSCCFLLGLAAFASSCSAASASCRCHRLMLLCSFYNVNLDASHAQQSFLCVLYPAQAKMSMKTCTL